nr:TonB-dependent receptor [Pyrinomonadaceae bacterium]
MASVLHTSPQPGDKAHRGSAFIRRRIIRARPLALLFLIAQTFPTASIDSLGVSARQAIADDFRGAGIATKTARRFAQDQARPSNPSLNLTGQVVDARTGEPVAKVKIIVVGSEVSTTTDERGAFTIQNLPLGPIELYITTVNYGLVRKIISPDERANAQGVRIALNQEAATLTEQVTVTAGPFEETETNAASEQTLNKAELQTLSSVIAGDPLRAAQSLPSVTANDDYRSDFAVRGAGFRRVGVYVDGVLTDNFVHTVQGNFPDTGSLSVINADTLSAVTLLSGAFPAKFGHRTAAVLNLETRDGNRVKPAGRLAASLSSASGVVDSPFAQGRGSWLVAARKSYLGYLVRRVNEANESAGDSVFDFADVQSKAIYDLTPRHRAGVSAIFGTFGFDRDRARDQLGINSLLEADSRNLLVNAHWSYTPDPRLLVGTRVFALRSDFTNRNRDRLILDDGQRTQIGLRSDVNYLWRAAHRIEAGVYLRSVRGERFTERFAFFQPATRDVTTFERRAFEGGYYAQDTWSSERFGLSATGGARIEHSGLTGETIISPRAALGFAPGDNWRVRAAFGRHDQFPDFEDLFGRLGNPNVRAERATHYNASVERMFGSRMRVLVEVYDRKDSGLLFSLFEPRVEAGRITFAEFP